MSELSWDQIRAAQNEDRLADMEARIRVEVWAEALRVVKGVEWHHLGDSDWAGGMEHAKDDILRVLLDAQTLSPETRQRFVLRQRAEQAEARSADIEARIEQVRALHQRESSVIREGFHCSTCVDDEYRWNPWPCPTVALLDAAPAGGAEERPASMFRQDPAEAWHEPCPDEPGYGAALDAPSEVPHD